MVVLTNSGAAAIAERLSIAQRRLVLDSDPDDIDGIEGCGVDIAGATYSTARVLERLGIGRYTHGSSIADMYWNNSFGLKVREALLSAAKSHEER